MQPGDLREKITFQRPVTQREAGTPRKIKTFVDLSTNATVYARIMPMSGREIEQAGTVQSRQQYKLTIRTRDDINTTQRIIWGSKTLNIIMSEAPSQGRPYISLIVEEGKPE